jgi:hypothetical protein
VRRDDTFSDAPPISQIPARAARSFHRLRSYLLSITAIAVLAFVVVAFSLVSAAVIWFAREDAVR